jgi:hypothetical protein
MSDPATKPETATPARREVAADLVEMTPGANGLLHWLLASPILLFIAWGWVDLFAHYSPLPAYWLDALVGMVVMAVAFVLPLGYGAFRFVTSFPRLFQHAGWDVQPLERVSEAEMHLVRYRFRNRQRAAPGWRRAWLRAAQGWVYIEIAAIFVGAVLMIPLFFSATEFGFGQP